MKLKLSLHISIKIAIFLALLCFLFLWKNYSASSPQSKEKKPFYKAIQGDFENKFSFQESDKIGLSSIGEPPKKSLSLLSGEDSFSPSEGVFAVMIDNHHSARKYHKGIDKARIVFEAPAEGGIPRWVALYNNSDDIASIGPIRSTRDYFLDILRPLHPTIVHAGGSPEALAELEDSEKFLNLDHDYGDEKFWRDDEIARPHNLFISSAEIFNYSEEEKWENALTENVLEYGRLFLLGEKVDEFFIKFSTSSYNLSWKWDDNQNCFMRNQDNELLEICVQNVIVIVSEQWRLEDDKKYRIGIETTGEGVAYVFRDGKYLKCTWQREEDGFFRFVDENNEPVKLHSGQSFFELLDSEERVELDE